MYNYSDWLAFTFGLAGPPSLLDYNNYPGPADELLAHCLTFMRSGKTSIVNVSYPRVEMALRMIPSIDGYLGVLSCPDLPTTSRVELAKAHFELFRDVFFFESYGSAAFMWWEWLPGASYKDGPPVFSDKNVVNCLIEVLRKIFCLSSEICHKSALHGLNELGPYVQMNLKVEVGEFIRSNPHVSDEIRRYALEVAEGNAQ